MGLISMHEQIPDLEIARFLWFQQSVENEIAGRTANSGTPMSKYSDTSHEGQAIVKTPTGREALFMLTRHLDIENGEPIATHRINFYLKTDASANENLAEFWFQKMSANHFWFRHRLVRPDDRYRGVGTFVYKIAESWFRALAQRTKTPIQITLGIYQPNVWDWVEKMGFIVEPDDRAALEHARNNPAEYTLDSSDKFAAAPRILSKSTGEQVEVHFKKTILP